jgi:uncharacterized cupredoxin-like copper-binding protein
MKALAMTTAALLVVGLVGCGSEDEEPAAQRASSGPQTVAVSETEFKLDPADPKVDPGVITFEVSNDGKATHSLEVEGPDGQVALEKTLQPGRSETLEVNLSRSGRYEWYCPIDGHKDSGMRGEITVGDGGSAGAGGAPNDADEGGGGLSY